VSDFFLSFYQGHGFSELPGRDVIRSGCFYQQCKSRPGIRRG
jgi:hypothetical protein